jgi:hypothetical protein
MFNIRNPVQFLEKLLQLVIYVMTVDFGNVSCAIKLSNHRDFGTFPVEDLAHHCGRTLVHAEYGYPKESRNTNS